MFFLATFAKLFAQETTSEIQGVVTDDKGQGLQGATIVATHLPTSTTYTTTTRKDGLYNLPNLRVGGPYVITVTYVGFNAEKHENVSLLLGQEFKADFTMKSSSQQLSEVVISTNRQGKLFNTNHTGSQEIIGRSQIERLPTINRSLQDFTKLEPTASTTSFGQSFGGRSSQYNNITVDGANFNNSFGLSGTLGGQTNSQPISLDAIEQIQVNVSPYDVRQGGFSGAGVNTVTRSGTNQIKGSVYTYLKGPGTIGYNVDNTKVVKTDFKYNLRGISVGGPIIKDKIFFFISAEQVRQTQPATSITASDAGHAPGGNVSIANADTLNTLRTFLKNKYGYDPGEFQGYTFNTNSDKITAKIDFNINKNNTLSVKYSYLKSNADQFASTSRPAGTTGGQPGTNSLPFYGSGYVINNNFNIVIAELNTRFGNKASNKLQAGYTALRDFRSPHSASSSFPLVDILNAGNVYTTFGYEPYTYNNILNTDVYQFSDIFTMYKGSHELTLGTQDYHRKYANAFAPGYQGAFQFNSLTDFYNAANNGAANAKSYYLQYSALPKGDFPFAYAGSTEIGVFAQDKWRVSNNFTLVYGLRIDATIYKQSFTDNPHFDSLTFKNGATYDIGKAPSTQPLWSPRLGFNWDVNGNKRTQVRGGFGIFSGPPPFVWISNQASNNGIQFGSFTKTNVRFMPDSSYRPAAGAPNTSYSVALTDHDFKYPTVLKSSLAVDKKLGDSWVVTLEGSYTKDINAVYYSNLNLNESNAFALAGADKRLRYLTAVSTSNKYYYAGTSQSNPNLGTAILMSNSNKGYAYTATVRVQKTFRFLDLSAAYTYSKAKNTAEGGSTASSLWSGRPVSEDPNNDNLAYASYYQPHRVIATAAYRIEYGKHYATSIGAIFEAAPNGVTSYVYNGDLNGDGNTSNDLIYVPRDKSEINLVKSGSGGLGTGTSTDPRTAAQMWNQLNNFINQDHYLNFHRGEYAKANAVVYPFFKQLDLNITQDIYIKSGKDRHTLRLSVDLLNVGNFLNRNWGLRKTYNLNNFLRYEGLAADGKTPSYSFTYLDATNQVPLTNTWTNTTNINASTGASSRYQMQFGIRYLFN
jgi:hypothetical protein